MSLDERVARLREVYGNAGQGHVLQFIDGLPTIQKDQLIAELEELDVNRLNLAYTSALTFEAEMKVRSATFETIPPYAKAFVTPDGTTQAQLDGWYQDGLQAIGQGKVGLVLMAGGQGTRLGSDAPKGCYDIGMPSHKSLYQMQADRLSRLQDLASTAAGVSCVVPWYVMTSPATYAATKSFFEAHRFWGLNPDNVHFFNQGTLPALSNDGKIILDKPYSIAMSPDGNGGIYHALKLTGMLADMEKRGVEYVHCYSVDNCLVKVADPTFIGYCMGTGAGCGAKVIGKAYPEEPVGVLALHEKKPQVVEYSELPADLKTAKLANGELMFNAGNIANHFYTRGFLEQVANWPVGKLPYHIARKKIPFVDPTGATQTPTTPNGMKLEMFIFDVFPECDRLAVLEVRREDEFAPLKNAPGSGKDCPETSCAAMNALNRRWAAAAGAIVEGDGLLDIDQRLTYGGEGLEAKLRGQVLTTPRHVNM